MTESLNLRDYLKMARERGPKPAFLAFATALFFAVVAALVSGIVDDLADAVRRAFRSPEFVIGFSAPLKKEPTVKFDSLSEREVRIKKVTPWKVFAEGTDNHYWIELVLKDGETERSLRDAISLPEKDRTVFLETGPSAEWVSVQVVRPPPGP